MMQPVAIGIDLGGTNLRVAVVDAEGRIRARRAGAVDAARGPDAVIVDIVDAVDAVLRDVSLRRADALGVGLGVPGPLNLREGRIVRAANLPGWRNVPLRDRLADAIGLPVTLDNDGNAAAYGEFWAGVGRNAGDMVMLTLGTGVGAGVILDGRVLHGHFDNAAELGHTIVVPGGLPCPCGQRGCLEQYASAANVARRAVAAVETGEGGALADLMQAGKTIDATHVVQYARAGDALAERIWDEACFYLAIACVNIQHFYNPTRIVFGGGLSRAGGFLIDRIGAHLGQQRWSLHNDVPALALAVLGYDAGIIGAAGLAWQRKRGHH